MASSLPLLRTVPSAGGVTIVADRPLTHNDMLVLKHLLGRIEGIGKIEQITSYMVAVGADVKTSTAFIVREVDRKLKSKYDNYGDFGFARLVRTDTQANTERVCFVYVFAAPVLLEGRRLRIIERLNEILTRALRGASADVVANEPSHLVLEITIRERSTFPFREVCKLASLDVRELFVPDPRVESTEVFLEMLQRKGWL